MNGINAFPPKAFGSDSYFGSGGFFPAGAAVDPTGLYGSMKGLFTVTYVSAGLYKVTMNPKMSAPVNPVTKQVQAPRIGVTPICESGVPFLAVRTGVWDTTDNSFLIQALDFTGAAYEVAANADNAIEFTFELTNHDRPR